ncbi:class I SAM-dependent methyltransferase [Streptomyces diastatochromogenes]|uniref:Methyltransferase type 12 domain-containing protein n=1 Tax=Streptomyces diastatochromogenes TaxID=42236 RepID=A0A233S8W4_STRDA|nr:class I SAM-dependent methyltransferase [Streptomyces diastatochromogenes]MCZ0990423.1 class I SAM-dependent methyltransferase [Streptomyces diastatochromogenes]OXY92014.1 hypothetical protein BEK98_27845 [Streptomyces diastatochromogenes]
MNAFAGTSSYYRRLRPGIPVELAALLDAAAPVGSPRRLLDVGTGPGLVAHALLRYFDDLFAVDSDTAMLAEAETMLQSAVSASHRLQIRHTRAEDFVPPEGWRPHLVTCCRVFHWLDQRRFLDRLSEYVAPDGVVAVFSDRSLWTADNEWQQAARAVVREFLGEHRRAGAGVFGPPGPPFADVLRASAFCDVTTTVIPVHREWIIAKVTGYLYSTSFAAPQLFGDRRRAFETALEDALAPFTTGGVLTEDNAFTVHTARRPSPSKDQQWT